MYKAMLEAQGSVYKYHVFHMDNGNHDTCLGICEISPAIPMSSIYLGDSSDISCGIYLSVGFMTVVAVYPKAIIHGWLL